MKANTEKTANRLHLEAVVDQTTSEALKHLDELRRKIIGLAYSCETDEATDWGYAADANHLLNEISELNQNCNRQPVAD